MYNTEIEISWEPKKRQKESLFELVVRTRRTDETIEQYAINIRTLVHGAYPQFSDLAREVMAKEYFVKGLDEQLKHLLKSSENFACMDVDELVAVVTQQGENQIQDRGV